MEWVLLAILGTVFSTLLLVYVRNMQFSRRGMPPGPLTVPILGSIPAALMLRPIWNPKELLHFKIWEYIHIASKKYGGIFCGTMGKRTGVVFTDYDMIREVENMDEYSMKVCDDLTMLRTKGKELGLIFAATPQLWMEMRKFSQRTLRDFGFGKRQSMQSVIEAEISELVKEFGDEIKKSEGILTIRTNFILSVLNVLWCMIAGVRYAHDDPKLVKMVDKNFAMTKTLTFCDPLLLGFKFLRDIFPKAFNWDLTLSSFEDVHVYSQSLIDERRLEGAYLYEPQNYIDCFLKKIEENKNETYAIHTTDTAQITVESIKRSNSVYTDDNLQIMIEDFMQTGSSTSVGTLNYAILFITLNPQVQVRCQAEIDAIVPKNMVPTLDDIEKMPYFQATILETHRLGNVVPIPVPRVVPKDWNYRGYLIPKGTYILSNHYSIMMDEDYWGDPHNFRPERFLNENGEFVPDKRVVHFGFGKRYCIGVTLANSVIPIYMATLLQNFTFSTVPGEKIPTNEPEVGVSVSPKEFRCHVTSRK